VASATEPGGSSIAVLVAEASANFVRCDVTAGDGAAGAAGDAFPTPAQAGTPGSAGMDACVAQIISQPGGMVITQCADASSTGGLGGNGSPEQGGEGSPGARSSGPSSESMNGGLGEGKGWDRAREVFRAPSIASP
jgi:hypothetical protein